MGATILIVEDDRNIGNLVRTYLERDGYRVVWVRSGEEGLAELERQRPGLVVLDVGLPGIDGFEVCRRVRALGDTPVIMLTAVVVTAQGGGRERVRVTYDRRAAVAYADAWALKVNPEYWSSPDNDCANFVSQCLLAGGLRPTNDAGREWRPNGTDFPTVAWVNCGAQKRALSTGVAGHSRYIVRATRRMPRQWARGDIVYLGNVVDGKVEWQHVIICAGRRGGEWAYDSHTAAHRRVHLDRWYPAQFTEVRFCRIADRVSYAAEE